MTASIIIDAIFAGILLICMVASLRRGFVQTILSIAGSIAAAAVALFAGRHISLYIYEHLVEQPLYNSILKKVLTLVPTGDIIGNVEDIGLVLPDMVKTLFDSAAADANHRIGETLSGTSEMVTQSVLDSLVGPLAIALLNLVVFFVLFGLLMVIVNILVSIAGRIFELPVIGGINRFLGALLGLVNGAIICIFASALLSLYATVTGDASSAINFATLDQTFIASLFIRNNPLLPMLM